MFKKLFFLPFIFACSATTIANTKQSDVQTNVTRPEQLKTSFFLVSQIDQQQQIVYPENFVTQLDLPSEMLWSCNTIQRQKNKDPYIEGAGFVCTDGEGIESVGLIAFCYTDKQDSEFHSMTLVSRNTDSEVKIAVGCTTK